MVYCQKCGTKNDDDAEFCKKCSVSLKDTAKDRKKAQDEKCEEDCAVGKHSPYAKVFWGALVILIGLAILFNVVIEQTTLGDKLPEVLKDFDFWWIVLLLIAVAFIITGLRIATRK
ncbi:MAG: zinc-ribbon domain-containing protein [Thermoplasmatales archaeon]|nr:MAG: zinc-ribbon domain-containing protein [Thermoplasmatales archaeon]